MKERYVLTDIMGTTTPTSFLKTLMMDFIQNGSEYLTSATPEAIKLIDSIKEEQELTTGKQAIEYVANQLMKRNLRTDFLELIGFVNVEGYQTGRLSGEVFNDVPVAFQNWKDNGKGIFIYSNGSAESQKELYQSSNKGDLTGLINGYFDTNIVGDKSKKDSYLIIADKVQEAPKRILFISDVLPELDAADSAGYNVKLVVRPGNKSVTENDYKIVTSFTEL
ncbi:acireductone synthase [archaeon]|jgi:enolase-phosphatase E1|nr:acireductone synthase [archaeon]MBT3451047.1 acireductone synthase [archaeon]MBT6869137.1 acireductone synthase [archaeon]MBT7192784.1 acireductone synthase [archaeon]MBT7381324.1 acireductone synthase [archaeon]